MDHLPSSKDKQSAPTSADSDDRKLSSSAIPGGATSMGPASISPHLLLDSIRQAVIATTPDGRIIYWNKGAERLYGWKAEAVKGRLILDVTVPNVTRQQGSEIMEHLERGEEWSGRFIVQRKDGSLFEADIYDKPVIDENGRLVAVVGVSEDASAFEETLDALQHSEERFRHAAETVPDIFFITDDRIRTLYINKRFTEYTGKPSRYAHGTGWIRILHPDQVEDIVAYWSHCMESEREAEFKHLMRMADESYRWFITRSKPVRGDDGRIRYWFGTSTDIDDLVRAEEEIKALNATLEKRVHERTQQVRALSSALTLAEQRERKRVARFLHDDLQQFLYGIKLKSEVAARSLSDPTTRSKLKELGQSLSEAIQSVRSLTIELSPPVLRGEGLQAALTWLAGHLEEQYGLRVDLGACAGSEVPHEDQRILLFQLVRELLFNVVKHAHTDRAEVELERRDLELIVRVRDEGVGFDVDEVNRREHWDSFGLFSIRERLALFGGKLDVASRPGSGSTLTIRLPTDE